MIEDTRKAKLRLGKKWRQRDGSEGDGDPTTLAGRGSGRVLVDGGEMIVPLVLQIRAVGLPRPVEEFRFHPKRRFRFDLAWPVRKLAVEIEGGTWSRGRHTRGKGFAADCIKYNEAALLGWHVLRVTTEMVEDGTALAYIERALGDDE